MLKRPKFDLNTLRDNRAAAKEKEDQEKFEKLAGDAVMLFDNLLKSTFPTDANTGDPDWEKFNWDKAEQLKQLLADFQAGRTRRPSDDEPIQRTQRRQAPASAVPATTVQEPSTDTANPPAAPKWRQRIGNLRQNG